MDKIKFSEAKIIMEKRDFSGNPLPFSIRFITCNRNKGTGGEVIALDNCIKHALLKIRLTKNARPFASLPAPTVKSKVNHHKNQTTNLAVMTENELTGKLVFTGTIQQVHYRLITHLNGKEIIWD